MSADEESLVGTVAGPDLVLRRCVALAAEALAAGDDPFGSVLVAGDGTVLAEDRNRESTRSDPTYHPEIMLARWAAAHLSPAARREASVYTSGEHCAMCAAAHGWVGLGPITTIATAEQFAGWRREANAGPLAVRSLAVRDVVPGAVVTGPVEAYCDEVRALYRQCLARTAGSAAG